MPHYDPDYVKIIVNQRHKEWLREAEQSRLLKATRTQRPAPHWISTFRSAASWLVEWLMEWSSRLRCLARGYLAAVAGGC